MVRDERWLGVEGVLERCCDGTLGASCPRFWIDDDFREQQALHHRGFSQRSVDRFAGIVSKRLHSELVSSGHNGGALGPHSELPCTAPLMATSEIRCPFRLCEFLCGASFSLVWKLYGFKVMSLLVNLLCPKPKY